MHVREKTLNKNKGQALLTAFFYEKEMSSLLEKNSNNSSFWSGADNDKYKSLNMSCIS